MTNALEIVHDHALQQLEKVTKETLAASASVEIFDEAHPVYTAFHSIQNVLQTVTKQISYRASYSVLVHTAFVTNDTFPKICSCAIFLY